MKKILFTILASLFLFPLLTLASCTGRSMVDNQNGSNCSGSGGSWNSGSCTCSCPTGYYVEGGSGGSCISTGYQGSESQGDNFGGSSDNGSSGGSGGSGNGGTSLGSSTGGISNPIAAGTFGELVDMVVKWILDIAMVLAPLIIVYGGFTYITAAGDPSKMKTGKNIILYAALGFLLALLASSLVDILKNLASGG